MTYISSQALTASSRQAVLQAQSQLARVQKQLSSGTLADVGLGLGSSSGQYVGLTNQQNQLQAITDDNSLAATRLASTATALTSLQTTASSFLSSLTAAASSGGISNTVQSTATGNLGALISTLNTSVAGQFIFGGINSGTAPMADYASTPASASKTAVDAAFSATFGTTQTSASASSISGAAMTSFLNTTFASLFGGASFTSTWSSASDQPITSQISTSQTAATSISANTGAMQKLAQAYTMVSEFGGQNFGTAAGQAVIASATQLVSGAISDLTNLQAGVGIVQSSITNANASMAAQISVLSTQSDSMAGLSSTQTLDLTSQVSTLQTQIEASFEVTAKLQQMSLVNYMA